MSLQLSKTIYKETDSRLFVSRVARSLRAIYQEKGCAIGTFTASALTSAKIYSLAICYFCMEGSVRAILDIAEYGDDDQIVRLRPFGDASGWTAQSVFTVLALGTLIIRVIREGEALKLKSLCQQWVDDNQQLILEKPQLRNNLYLKIVEILDSYHSQCLFSKWVVSRRITALEIKRTKSLCKQRLRDKRLKKILLKIKKDIHLATSTKKYFHRLCDGQKSHWQVGYKNQLSSCVMGVALPIMMLTACVLSYVGEVGLGKQLFHDREEKTDVGHFGEWLFNAIEIIGVAVFFHMTSMVNEGDFARVRGVYKHYIKKLKKKNERELHNRLCDIANAELAQMQSNRLFFQLPDFYNFKKYEKEINAI